ncbi:MAG: DMT family transporter [Rhodobacteraceae bacterium]|nr:DMT family transporter [Paracoccaceae bacterium]
MCRRGVVREVPDSAASDRDVPARVGYAGAMRAPDLSDTSASTVDGVGTRTVWLARGALCLTTLLWSGNLVAGRALGGTVDPVTLNALRWLLALVLFLPFAGPRLMAQRRVLRRHAVLLIALGLTGVVLFHVCVYSAMGHVPVANASLMVATTPFFILAGSALTGYRRLGLRDAAAVVLSLAGVAILLTDGHFGSLAAIRPGIGDLWMVGAVLSWAVYTLLLRALPADLPRDAVLAVTMLVGVVVMLPLWLGLGTTDLAGLPAAAWAGVVYVAVGASLVAYLFWSFGVDRLGPEAAGFFLNLMPVFGVILAWLLLGEAISLAQAAGAVAIMLAIGLRRG